jgi:hypothetical protein
MGRPQFGGRYPLGSGRRGPLRRQAAELVARAPDVILAATTSAVLALKRATSTIPIVFVGVIDPVGSGLVASLARPAGNATGFILFEYAIATKWLELVTEIAPSVTRVAVLRDSAIAAGIGQFAAVQAVAPMNIELSVIGLRDVGGRAIHYDIRGQRERRLDCDGRRVQRKPSKSHRRVGGPVQTTCDLSFSLIRKFRRLDILRT